MGINAEYMGKHHGSIKATNPSSRSQLRERCQGYPERLSWQKQGNRFFFGCISRFEKRKPQKSLLKFLRSCAPRESLRRTTTEASKSSTHLPVRRNLLRRPRRFANADVVAASPRRKGVPASPRRRGVPADARRQKNPARRPKKRRRRSCKKAKKPKRKTCRRRRKPKKRVCKPKKRTVVRKRSCKRRRR